MEPRTLSTGNLALDVLVRQAENRLTMEAQGLAMEAHGRTASPGLADPSSSSTARFLRAAGSSDSTGSGGPGCIQRRRSPGLGAALRGAHDKARGRRAESEIMVRGRPSSTSALKSWVCEQLDELKEAQRSMQANIERQLDLQRAAADAGHARLQSSVTAELASQRDAFEAHASSSAAAIQDARDDCAEQIKGSGALSSEEHWRATESKLQRVEAKLESLSRRAENPPDAIPPDLRGTLEAQAAELERQRAALRELGQMGVRFAKDSRRIVAEEVQTLGLDARQGAMEASLEILHNCVMGLEGKVLDGLTGVSEMLKEPRAAPGSEETWEAHIRASSSSMRAMEARLWEGISQVSEQQQELRKHIAEVAEEEKAAREALQWRVGHRLSEEGADREVRRAALQATLDALHAEHSAALGSLESRLGRLEQLDSVEVRIQQLERLSAGLEVPSKRLEVPAQEKLDAVVRLSEEHGRAQLALQSLMAEHAAELKGQREMLQEHASELKGQHEKLQEHASELKGQRERLQEQTSGLRGQGEQLKEQASELRSQGERLKDVVELVAELRDRQPVRKDDTCDADRKVLSRTFIEQVHDLDIIKPLPDVCEEDEPENEEPGGGISPADAGAGTRDSKSWVLQLLESEREARVELARSVEAERALRDEAKLELQEQLASQFQQQLHEAIEFARDEWETRLGEAMARFAEELRAPVEAAEKSAAEAARRANFYTQELSMADTEHSGRLRDTAALRQAVEGVSQRVAGLEVKVESLVDGSQRPVTTPGRGAGAQLEQMRRELRDELQAELDDVRADLRGECDSLARRYSAEARSAIAMQLEGRVDARLDARLEARESRVEAVLTDRLSRLERHLEEVDGRGGAQARTQQGLSRSPSRGLAPGAQQQLLAAEPLANTPAVVAPTARRYSDPLWARSANAETMRMHQIS